MFFVNFKDLDSFALNIVSEDQMADHVEIKIDIVAKEPIEQAETYEQKQPDVENGHEAGDGEEELTLMHYAEVSSLCIICRSLIACWQTIEVIDFGCPVKVKVGVSGDTPEKDSFPFFKSSKKFLCLLWGGDAHEWRLLTFDGRILCSANFFLDLL